MQSYIHERFSKLNWRRRELVTLDLTRCAVRAISVVVLESRAAPCNVFRVDKSVTFLFLFEALSNLGQKHRKKYHCWYQLDLLKVLLETGINILIANSLVPEVASFPIASSRMLSFSLWIILLGSFSERHNRFPSMAVSTGGRFFCFLVNPGFFEKRI